MNDTQLYARILGISKPWTVTGVSLSEGMGEVVVRVAMRSNASVACPTCGEKAARHDHRRGRRWRHLDTCQFRTIIEADVPRVKCPEHGVLQVAVPWGEPGSRFTALFEALVLDWLLESSIAGVARLMSLSWHEVNGIMERAVRRGLERRELALPAAVGVDETSYQKRHDYVTIVHDLDADEKPVVLHVADGRGSDALASFYEQFDESELESLETVAMDMSSAFIRATRDHVPGADDKIAFDRFHIAKLLGDAVDHVRREENRELLQSGIRMLVGTRYHWLENPLYMSDTRWEAFEKLRASKLKTARAWAIKDAASALWDVAERGEVEDTWMRWLMWPDRSRLGPMKKVAKTIRKHLWGIVNAVMAGVTNARAEGINAIVQKLKRRAHGYRNKSRFRNAIYFHLGGLDLKPHLS